MAVGPGRSPVMPHRVNVMFMKKKNNKKAKGYYFVVDLTVFVFEILIAVDMSKKELTDLIRRKVVKECYPLFVEGIEEHYGDLVSWCGWVSNGGHNYSYIYLNSDMIKADSGLIAHEAYHAIDDIFTHLGAPVHDSEPFAYTLGYLVREINNGIKEHGKKKKS
jgi:hypothetical protein